MTDSEYLYKVAEVASYLRISRMSVYRMVEDGRLRAVTVGDKIVRIPASAVAEMTGGLLPPQEGTPAS